jgi:large conductance mechanosensitive channel
MHKLIKDFGDFINKGNVLTIAIGLVMALYFQKIVEAVLDGVINPIIAAIFGKNNFTEIGFDIGEARISIGLVIDAIISFVAVAFFLFLIVEAYNRMRPAGEPDVSPATEVALLTDIRDLLSQRQP